MGCAALRLAALAALHGCWGGYLLEGARPETSIMAHAHGGYVEAPLAVKRYADNPKPPSDGVDRYPSIGSSAAGALGLMGRYAPDPYVQLSLGLEAGAVSGPGVFGAIYPGVKVLLTPAEPAAPVYLGLALRGVFLGAIQGESATFSVLGGEAFLPLSVVVTPLVELYVAPMGSVEHHTVHSGESRPDDWGPYDYPAEYSEEFVWAGGVFGSVWTPGVANLRVTVELYGGRAVPEVLDGAGGWRLGLAVGAGFLLGGDAPPTAGEPEPPPPPRGVLRR